MELSMKDVDSKLQLNEAVFDYPFNEGLVHQVVVAYLNASRSGNSVQKTRAEVRGGGRKPWAQKGTGRARAGSIRSPIWRSGGVTFASKQRDYSQKINKKMYQRAIRSIMSELCRTENLIIVNEFQCASHKTADFLKKMESLEINSALIVTHNPNENEYLGSRNLKDYEICDIDSVNPVSLLNYEKVVITAEAIKKIEEQLL